MHAHGIGSHPHGLPTASLPHAGAHARVQIEKLLADTLAELASLKEGDAIERLMRVYKAMTTDQKEETLTVHLFPTPETASAMTGRSTAEVGGWMVHFLSALPSVPTHEDDATLGSVNGRG